MNNPTLNYDHMLGSWKNSYVTSKGISHFVISSDDNGPTIRIEGVQGGLVSGDWGTSSLSPFAYKTPQEKADGFIGNVKTSDFDVFLCIYNNKGLIILEAVVQF